MRRAVPIAMLLGALTVLGFAPFGLYALPFVTFALLVVLWRRASRPRHAAIIGFAFGVGFFLTGVSWVYVSLHDFGGMPAALAGALTLLFCCYLALHPALVGWLYRKLPQSSLWSTLVFLPGAWAFSEWVRGTLWTGFPWIAIGYSQAPASPLAGYFPLFGVYGVSLLLMASAAAIAISSHRGGSSPRAGFRYPAVGVVLGLWLGGYVLQQVEWTQPAGQPTTVALLQGNVPQELKWREDQIKRTLDNYLALVRSSKAQLIVLPETALPLFLHDVPGGYLEALRDEARRHGGDVLIGIPERDSSRHYYNSVLSYGTAATQTYRKSHLVPFGEFVPLKLLFGWFFEVTQIPLLDFSRGTATQQPLAVAGQLAAINICYEDAFGAEIIRQLPAATLLVNVSNVAWFGRSIAPAQHLQISQARALETGRYMLRATNTGMTAIINERGIVEQVAPEYATAILSGHVQGHTGATPYVRWGDYPVIAITLLLVLAACWLAMGGSGKIRAFSER